MTFDEMAALHGASFTMPRPWSAVEFAELLASPRVFALTTGAEGLLLGRVVVDEAELLTIAVDPAINVSAGDSGARSGSVITGRGPMTLTSISPSSRGSLHEASGASSARSAINAERDAGGISGLCVKHGAGGKRGADGGTRTHTPKREADFKSAASID